MIKKRKKRIMITGIAGFVGSHFVEHILKNTDWDIIGLDSLTYAGNLNRLTNIRVLGLFQKRVKFIYHDLRSAIPETIHNMIGKLDYVIHLASETHVDNSLKDSIPFIMSNVLGTANLFEYLKKQQRQVKKIISFNTDEVFGPAPEGVYYREYNKFTPSNPYSAAKAGQAALDYAFYNSFDIPIITTFCVNIIGEKQHSEKFLPTIIRKMLKREKIPLYGNNQYDLSYRHWIHARNVANAIMFLLKNGESGERYNIVGEERSILEVANMVCKIIKRRPIEERDIDWVGFATIRPGHDRRYALSGEKLAKMGWKAPMGLEETIKSIVKWSIKSENRYWLNL
jgi:dTDP-glucose 4,6-dehydratase